LLCYLVLMMRMPGGKYEHVTRNWPGRKWIAHGVVFVAIRVRPGRAGIATPHGGRGHGRQCALDEFPFAGQAFEKSDDPVHEGLATAEGPQVRAEVFPSLYVWSLPNLFLDPRFDNERCVVDH
jgi:hypothetical protein